MPAQSENPLRRGLRLFGAALLTLLLSAVLLSNTATALNVYSDHFVRLSARPLGMGGAFAALSGPESVFYNPAGLATVRQLRFLHNHSARHFPGSSEGGTNERDQLDGDTQCITVPLPLLTYAHGLTLSGEMGYDFRMHPEDGSLGYPRENYWGTEDYDAAGLNLGLPVSAGYALRRHSGVFTPDEEDLSTPAWLRLGDGEQWGVIARIWPGLDYGHSELRMDYDWRVLEEGSGRELPSFSSRLKQKRSGYALQPTAWLTLANDRVVENWIYENPKQPEEGLAFAGRLHSGNREIERLHSGIELNLGNQLWLRQGSYDGRESLGLSLNFLGSKLNYAEVKNLLPEIVGAGSGFENIHIYGFDVPLS